MTHSRPWCSAAPARPAAASSSGCGARACRCASARARRAAVRLGGPRDLGAARSRASSAAYISYYPDLAVPGAAETIGALARLAAERGVKRLVLLSGRGEAEAQRAEQALQAAGAEWTVVRCSWFAQNFSESVHARRPSSPARSRCRSARVPEPFVDAEDIADVAVAALTEDGHAGAGLRADRPARAALRRGGRRDRRRHRPPDRASRPSPVGRIHAPACARHGVPDDDGRARRLAVHRGARRAQRAAADGVQRALGRAPRDFGEYARTAAAAGAWS